MLVSAYLGQHPDRVAFAVLAEPFSLKPSVADSGVFSPIAVPESKIIKSASSKDHYKSDLKYLNQLHSKQQFPGLGSCNPEIWHGQSILRPGALAAKKISEEFYSPEEGFFVDFTVGNERFKNTVLLLFSECNSYFTEESKKRLTDELNRAIYKTVPGSGHFMFDDNPKSSVIFIRKYFNNPSMIRTNKTFSFN
jgi:pimeloyl-ACP methyl ester carboxylesterase